ncbi:MAG: TVP38/TMEM64 family protein [Clostridia bacterium]|nr:TVP38/TMEM64 family protein [Clostridia bacterium]
MQQEPLSRDTKESIRRRRIVSIVSILLILIIFGLITWLVGYPLIQEYTQSPETFRDHIKEQGFLGQLTMIGIIMLQVVVALIPGEPLEVAAGFVFGWLEGALLCLIGSALAGALIMLAVRKWGIKLVEAFFSPEKINRFSFLRNEKKLNILMFILFLIPGTPKDILNYLAGLTPMKISTFVVITALARIPSVISSTITGHFAQDGNLAAAILTYGVTAVVSGVCILWYRKISRQEKLEKQQKAAHEE